MSQTWLKNWKSTYLANQLPPLKIKCFIANAEDLQVLKTTAGTPVVDVLRFFHGDGPAQQFEAGHKIGGKYSCVGCGALTSRFDDFAYCHHAPRQAFAERQEFVLQGQAWKQGGKNTQRCVN